MKKIRSKEFIAKKQRRNQFIVGGVMVFLMLFSTAGYALFNGESKDKGQHGDEEGNKGHFDGNYWIIEQGSEKYYFSKSLGEVENISVDVDVNLGNYLGAPLFIASDVDFVTNEIATNLNRYALRLQKACYKSCEEDLPEKNCTENLIVWKDSENNRVYQNESCVFIEGDIRAVDAFLYQILGIRKV